MHLFDIAKFIGVEKKQTKGERKEDLGQRVLLLHTELDLCDFDVTLFSVEEPLYITSSFSPMSKSLVFE